MFYLANTQDDAWYAKEVFRTYARALSVSDYGLEPLKYHTYAVASVYARGGRFYAVRDGRKIGIFTDQGQARAQVDRYSRAEWKGFDNYNAAKNYMDINDADSFDEDERLYYVVRNSESGQQGIWTKWQALIDNCGDPFRDSIEWKYFESLASAYLYIRGDDPNWGVHAGPLDEDPGVSVNEIYVDGCCLNNGKRNARGGWGLYWPQIKGSEWYGKVQNPSNNRAELMAIKAALDQIEKMEFYDDEHVIFTDSNYAINCIDNWGDNWERNGWYNSQGYPVHNAEIIQLVRAKWDELVDLHGFMISIGKVKGHAGVKGNEIADGLARMGATSREWD